MKFFTAILFCVAILLASLSECQAQCPGGQCTAVKQPAVNAAACTACNCHARHGITRTGSVIGNIRSRIQARRASGHGIRPIRRLFQIFRCR